LPVRRSSDLGCRGYAGQTIVLKSRFFSHLPDQQRQSSTQPAIGRMTSYAEVIPVKPDRSIISGLPTIQPE